MGKQNEETRQSITTSDAREGESVPADDWRKISILVGSLGLLDEGESDTANPTSNGMVLEATETVRYAAEGFPCPAIRKTFAGSVARGKAYKRILESQQAGMQFRHLPRVYECTEEEGSLSVVVEFVKGDTVAQFITREGPRARLAFSMGMGLCDALSEIHGMTPPLIHRDIKPSNVMVTSGGRIMLVDLGIARTMRSDATADTAHFGTPGFAPPEQYGFKQTDERSDLYATGMTLAFCLTGEIPTAELRESGFDDERIPARWRDVLMKATAFDPDARYQSAAELRAAIMPIW